MRLWSWTGVRSWGFWATQAVSLLSLTGFLAAELILPEPYGYVEQEKAEAAVAAGVPQREGSV